VKKARFQHKSQYADHELMMATAILFKMNIQIHGGIDTLLKVEGRTPRLIIDLLYSGVQTDLDRENHYDPLIPKVIPPNDLLNTSSWISEWVTVGQRKTTYISLSESPLSVIVSEVPSSPLPTHPKTRTPPISPSSTPPLSKHEKRQPWNRHMGIYGSPSPLSQEAPAGEGSKETGRMRPSTFARKKGRPPPKGHHRHATYPYDTTPSCDKKKH